MRRGRDGTDAPAQMSRCSYRRFPDRYTLGSLSPIGGEGWGEGADSRALANTHLTLPVAAQRVPSLSPLKGGEGKAATVRAPPRPVASAVVCRSAPARTSRRRATAL